MANIIALSCSKTVVAEQDLSFYCMFIKSEESIMREKYEARAKRFSNKFDKMIQMQLVWELSEQHLFSCP